MRNLTLGSRAVSTPTVVVAAGRPRGVGHRLDVVVVVLKDS